MLQSLHTATLQLNSIHTLSANCCTGGMEWRWKQIFARIRGMEWKFNRGSGGDRSEIRRRWVERCSFCPVKTSDPSETRLYLFNVSLLVVVERRSDVLFMKHLQPSVGAGRSQHPQTTSQRYLTARDADLHQTHTVMLWTNQKALREFTPLQKMPLWSSTQSQAGNRGFDGVLYKLWPLLASWLAASTWSEADRCH